MGGASSQELNTARNRYSQAKRKVEELEKSIKSEAAHREQLQKLRDAANEERVKAAKRQAEWERMAVSAKVVLARLQAEDAAEQRALEYARLKAHIEQNEREIRLRAAKLAEQTVGTKMAALNENLKVVATARAGLNTEKREFAQFLVVNGCAADAIAQLVVEMFGAYEEQLAQEQRNLNAGMLDMARDGGVNHLTSAAANGPLALTGTALHRHTN